MKLRFTSIFLVSLLVLAPAIPAVSADTWFTLADYRDLQARDKTTSELVLKAMREAVFYAQESAGGPVICASPLPIAGPRLAELLDGEIASPTNARGRSYTDKDQVAFIFVHALKNEGVCR